MAKKWEAPKILAIAALPRDLGDCWDGSSPGVTSQGECGCHNGENTVGRVAPVAICSLSIPNAYGHGCSSGGKPSTCFCGTAAIIPE